MHGTEGARTPGAEQGPRGESGSTAATTLSVSLAFPAGTAGNTAPPDSAAVRTKETSLGRQAQHPGQSALLHGGHVYRRRSREGGAPRAVKLAPVSPGLGGEKNERQSS